MELSVGGAKAGPEWSVAWSLYFTIDTGSFLAPPTGMNDDSSNSKDVSHCNPSAYSQGQAPPVSSRS